MEIDFIFYFSIYSEKADFEFSYVEAGNSYVPISLFFSFSMTDFFCKILVTPITYFKISLGKKPWVFKEVGNYVVKMS